MHNLLLHICCAPDATIPWPALIEEGYCVTGYFYGHNIHPQEEYNRRREAVETLASLLSQSVYIEEYNPNEWLEKAKALSEEPEGGRRCSLCFALQLEAAAQRARELSFSYLCTILTISPHKDPDRINRLGEEISARYGITWLNKIWRKNNGFVESVRKSREMNLYRQNYCGCCYSIHAESIDKRR